jgi:hypothetical protein
MTGRFVVGLIVLVGLAGCGASIQASSSGSNVGNFPIGTAGSYQYTVTTSAAVGGSAYLELNNNDVTCAGCLPAGSPWEVQLPIADGASAATGTIYLIAGNYTGVSSAGFSWSLTLSASG